MRKPLHLPDHRLKASSKEFGVDSLIAGGVNGVWTYLTEQLPLEALSMAQKNLLLSVAWPVFEKFGFFPRHILLAVQHWKGSLPAERKSFINYAKQVLKWGGVSMIKDATLHDPLHGALTYTWLQHDWGNLPPSVISFFSFLIALWGVLLIELWYDETKYIYFKHLLEQATFHLESYHEARLIMTKSINTAEVFDLLGEHATFDALSMREYNDTYYPTKRELYGGRYVDLRIRERICMDQQDIPTERSTQIVFTKPKKEVTKDLDQYNYFTIKKDKRFRKGHDIQGLDQYIQPTGELRHVTFHRAIARDTAWLLAAVDRMTTWECLIELKVHPGKQHILIQAVRDLQDTFGGLQQVTRGKQRLLLG
jgi:hypothetical protein